MFEKRIGINDLVAIPESILYQEFGQGKVVDASKRSITVEFAPGIIGTYQRDKNEIRKIG